MRSFGRLEKLLTDPCHIRFCMGCLFWCCLDWVPWWCPARICLWWPAWPVGSLLAKMQGWCSVTQRRYSWRRCVHGVPQDCWCNLFMLRENLVLQSSRMANHNQNSYICTPCEEAYLILGQASEVKSFHPIASSWQRPSAEEESCPCPLIPPPDSLLSQPEETLSSLAVLSPWTLGMHAQSRHRCTQLCWQCVLLSHHLNQFLMVLFRPLILPFLLAQVGEMELSREPGHSEFPHGYHCGMAPHRSGGERAEVLMHGFGVERTGRKSRKMADNGV